MKIDRNPLTKKIKKQILNLFKLQILTTFKKNGNKSMLLKVNKRGQQGEVL
jgi:hypothetical protein